jgi:hypothetical protein
VLPLLNIIFFPATIIKTQMPHIFDTTVRVWRIEKFSLLDSRSLRFPPDGHAVARSAAHSVSVQHLSSSQHPHTFLIHHPTTMATSVERNISDTIQPKIGLDNNIREQTTNIMKDLLADFVKMGMCALSFKYVVCCFHFWLDPYRSDMMLIKYCF